MHYSSAVFPHRPSVSILSIIVQDHPQPQLLTRELETRAAGATPDLGPEKHVRALRGELYFVLVSIPNPGTRGLRNPKGDGTRKTSASSGLWGGYCSFSFLLWEGQVGLLKPIFRAH